MYTTGENPRVGACLVKDGNLIAQGFHRAPGRPHAEIEVIKQTDADLVKESTCVVTLEPCSHVGKTGPCAEALIDAGIARVVVAMEDPNPLVAGRGLARLRDANIDVAVGLYSEEARSLNRGFIKRMMCGRPYVWLKSAASLDGKVACPTASLSDYWIGCASRCATNSCTLSGNCDGYQHGSCRRSATDRSI